MAKSPTRRPGRDARRGKLYSLDVVLLSGPVSQTFAKNNPVVRRTILVSGKQSLEDLHQAISTAFGYEGDYSFEFQFGKGPRDLEARRYVLPGAYEISVEDGQPAAGRVTDTTLDSLKFNVGQRFVYWLDFREGWWHQITVAAIESRIFKGNLPKVTKRVGPNPPQFPSDEAVTEAPENLLSESAVADTACLIGEMHLKKGAYAKAIEAFSRAIAAGPMADAYEGRAKAYRLLAAEDDRSAQAHRSELP
jgi:tetratricopeptide (TPR) repeat protein